MRYGILDAGSILARGSSNFVLGMFCFVIYDQESRRQLWVTSVVLCNRRLPVNFRYALLATEIARRCNMSRRANFGLSVFVLWAKL